MILNRAKIFIQECMDSCAGEEATAVELAKKRLNEDKQLFDSLIWLLLDWALPELVDKCTHRTRAQILRLASANPDDTSGLHSVMQAARQRYMDFPLKGGKRLGDATRDEIEAQRDIHRQQMEGHARMNEIYIGLLALIPKKGKKRFSAYVSEKQIAAVFEANQ